MKKFIISFLVCFLCLSFAFADEVVPHRSNIRLDQPCYLAIACVFQNEAQWLKEWIEYHRLVGVTHFYLYNNLSQDDYLSVLEPYVKKGIVELFEYPVEAFACKHQVFVYNHALALAIEDEVKWVALIDADEFLNPIYTNDLPTVLSNYENEAGLEIQWLMYGTSNISRLKSDQLMIDKLVYRARDNHPFNNFVKCIVQPTLAAKSVTPHLCKLVHDIEPYKMPLTTLRINHYYFRTEEFLNKVKIPRLRTRLKNGTGNVCTEKSILKFRPSANKVLDRSLDRFVKPLKKKMFKPIKPRKDV